MFSIKYRERRLFRILVLQCVALSIAKDAVSRMPKSTQRTVVSDVQPEVSRVLRCKFNSRIQPFPIKKNQ